MPETAQEELARIQQELQEIEWTIARSNPPLDLRTLGIAKAKIERLIRRIAELESSNESNR